MDFKSIDIVKVEPSGHMMVPRLHCESQLSKFRKSSMYKIHIRHIFQVFIPIQASKDELTISQQLLQEGDQFGFALLNKPTNQVFEYHLQLVDADEEGADRPNSFVWPKRTPIIIKNEDNSDSISGVIARIKIPTGKFDFRKVESQLLKLQVTCSSGGKFIGRARSDVVKLLPKKRGGLSDAEVVVPVQWLSTTSQYAPVSEDPNRLEFSPSLSHFSEQTPDPNFAEHRITVTPVSMLGTQEQSLALYHDGSDSSPEQLLSHSYSDLSPEMYQIMEHENSNNTNEQYMVLYNGNAEVIGNFRALNFYKASDINIKEDIRLISEFADARDVLLKIDGVDYKFKKGVNAAVNRRFVGYIAQQVESVVPDAVQLIDGILHVDYESLIPYLSESIRANFNDIKNNQAKTDRIEKIVDMLYQQFLKQDRSRFSDSQPTPSSKSSKLASRFTSLPLVWRVVVAVSIVAIVLAVATVIGVLAVPSHNSYQPQPTPVPLPATPTSTPTLTPTIPTPQLPPVPATPPFNPEAFRSQLIKLYQATNGGGWLRSDNWLSGDESVCTWYGVRCSSSTISIDLSNNDLTGTLPDELAEIPFIELVLANNRIEGTIPASIASLSTELKTLNVSWNKLNGRVRLNELLQLSLYVLDVSHNEFQGSISTPDSSVIKYLDLSYNWLGTQLPPFDKFTSLTHLDISNNNFFDNLPMLPSNLHYFSAAQNRLYGRTTRLSNVGGWVTEGMQLVIDVSHNNLDGAFFFNEKRAPYIKHLNISFNGFKDVSTLYPTFSDFFECDARNNSFACPIPDWLTSRCGATCQ